MGGRSDLFNSGGGGQKGEGYFQNSGGSWLKWELKNPGGVWTLDDAMTLSCTSLNSIWTSDSREWTSVS